MKQPFLFKVIRAISQIFSGFLFNNYYVVHALIRKLKVKNCKKVSNVKWNIKEEGFNINSFEYRDENWSETKYVWHRFKECRYDRKNIPIISDESNTSYRVKVFNEKKVCFLSDEKSKDRWIFLKYKEKIGSCYSVIFNLTIFSDFDEIQFDFNYRSIAQRMRFIFVNNTFLRLELMELGAFLKPLREVKFSFEHGITYKCRIEIIKDKFFFYINNELIIGVNVTEDIAAQENDDFAFIFWEMQDQRIINAKIEDLCIFSGEMTE